MPFTSRLGIHHSVLVAQPLHRPAGAPLFADIDAASLKFFSIPSSLGLPSAGAFLFAYALRAVRRIHARSPIDLVHAHAALPCGHAAMLIERRLGIPFVTTVHGLDAYFRNQVKGASGLKCESIARQVYARSRTVICISRAVEGVVQSGAGCVVKSEVVINGVDTTLFSPATGCEEPHTMFSLGSLIPSKGHESLLRAFAAISDRFPRATLRIAGEGPLLGNLQNLVELLGLQHRVTFLGRLSREQVADEMRRCTIFALPSVYEGLGCVYLEAMASGKPAVACRGQGPAELIEHGRTGWLTGPGDLPELTGALQTLLSDSDLRARIGSQARQSVCGRFSLSAMADRLAAIYSESAA